MDSDRMRALSAWLGQLDSAPLECDGFTRAASTLLAKYGVEHRVFIGSLAVEGVGGINPHFYLQFPDGAICDFRARIWLGDDPAVPHGIFVPSTAQRYEPEAEITVRPLGRALFFALSGMELENFGLPQLVSD